MAGSWQEPDTTCYGCDGALPGEEVGVVWLSTPLGLTVVRTHRDSGCAGLAAQRFPEQPARRVQEPRSREERMAEEVQRGRG